MGCVWAEFNSQHPDPSIRFAHSGSTTLELKRSESKDTELVKVQALMFFVYILRGPKNHLYVGVTEDFEKRLKRHKSGDGAEFTKRNKAFQLAYKETFKTLFDKWPTLGEAIEEIENETRGNTGQVVYVALGFSGEDQELRIIEKARQLPAETPTTPEVVASLRDGEGKIPPPDLLVRTSGEKRLSDVGWLAVRNTELYFSNKFFPDITMGDIVKALVDFSKRDRRFGGRPTK